VSKIVLEVSDGIARVVSNPDEVEIEIRDYDWPEEDLMEGQDYRLMQGTQELEYVEVGEESAVPPSPAA
jgi:hypothetical protein